MTQDTIRWLSAAHLGEMPEATILAEPATAISSALRQIRHWVHEWCNDADYAISQVSSTMAACDAALLAVAAEADVYLYTCFAHPTIEQSVRDMARLVGGIRGREVAVERIDLQDLGLEFAKALARSIADRISVAARGRRAALVVEHVTHDNGLRLPIGRIAEHLALSCPDLRLIIDGAQAVGIWRPPPLSFAAYLGCFHKFVGAPHASAFVAVAPPFADRLPAHVGNLCGRRDDQPTPIYQTVDLHKLRATAQILTTRHALDGLPNRLHRITAFNQALEAALAPRAISIGSNHDPALRSHITSVRFELVEEAAVAVEVAAGWGCRPALRQFAQD